MQGLLEAVEIEKGNIPLKQREGMSAPTYYVSENDEKLIHIREEENISQEKLAEKIGSQ